VGTADAGIIGGTTYGAAKKVKLHNVKIDDCVASPAVSVVIAGVDWVTHRFTRPAVAYLGEAMSTSAALSEALARSVDYGVTWVATSGWDGDACLLAAGVAQGVVVAGSTNAADTNNGHTGSCIDLFAPGSSIPTAGSASDVATVNRDRGWAAASFVAGLAALYLQASPNAGPGQVWDVLRGTAKTGVVGGAGTAPNRLARKWNYNLAAGASRYEPDNGTFTTAASGYIRGWLFGSTGTNFNLRLQHRDPTTLTWSTVATKATSKTKETVLYFGSAGTYRWLVESASGAGTYDLFALFPN
jgi:hypothetical protein